MTASTGDTGTRPVPPPIGLAATLRVLLKRWPIVGVGLIITELIGLGLVRVLPVSYTTEGTLLISLPQEQDTSRSAIPGTTLGVNPLLGSRGFIGDVLITLMADPDAEERVIARGGTGTFTTTLSLGDAALVKVATTGTSADEAMNTWNATAEEAAAALERLQREKAAPEQLLVTVDPLTRPARAERDTSLRIKAMLAAVALGIGLTIGTALGLERLAEQRRANGSTRSGPGRRGRHADLGEEFERAFGPDFGTSAVNGSGRDAEPADRPPRDGPERYSSTGSG